MDAKNLQRGQEQYEEFWSSVLRRKMVQYDYRAKTGQLFSTVAKDLETARAKRMFWMQTITEKALAAQGLSF